MATISFQGDQYLVRKNIFCFFGKKFQVFDQQGQQILFAKMKAFKLREDVRLFADTEMTQELFLIKARQILDFGATYDVTDSTTGQKIGALRRKGLKSMFRDEWEILDTTDQTVGKIQEDSLFLAMIRRNLLKILPQKYHVTIGEQPVCTFKQNFNPFVFKMAITFDGQNKQLLDKRLGIIAAVMLSAIEGRQQ